MLKITVYLENISNCTPILHCQYHIAACIEDLTNTNRRPFVIDFCGGPSDTTTLPDVSSPNEQVILYSDKKMEDFITQYQSKFQKKKDPQLIEKEEKEEKEEEKQFYAEIKGQAEQAWAQERKGKKSVKSKTKEQYITEYMSYSKWTKVKRNNIYNDYNYVIKNCADAINYMLDYFFPEAYVAKCWLIIKKLFCCLPAIVCLGGCCVPAPFFLSTPIDVFAKAKSISNTKKVPPFAKALAFGILAAGIIASLFFGIGFALALGGLIGWSAYVGLVTSNVIGVTVFSASNTVITATTTKYLMSKFNKETTVISYNKTSETEALVSTRSTSNKEKPVKEGTIPQSRSFRAQ